jgi:hypothetical protein
MLKMGYKERHLQTFVAIEAYEGAEGITINAVLVKTQVQLRMTKQKVSTGIILFQTGSTEIVGIRINVQSRISLRVETMSMQQYGRESHMFEKILQQSNCPRHFAEHLPRHTHLHKQVSHTVHLRRLMTDSFLSSKA